MKETLHGSRTLPWILIGLIVAAIGVFFRLYPITVYPHYAAKNDAQIVVLSNLHKVVKKYTLLRHPEASTQDLSKLENDEFKRLLSENKDKLNQALKEGTDRIFEAKTKGRNHFLMEVDSYYYLALTKNLIAHGRMADQIKNAKYFNEKMTAPLGFWYPFDLHPYTGYLLWSLVSPFHSGLSLEQVVSWVTVLLACLCLVPFIWITRRFFSLGLVSTAVGSLWLLLCPIFLRRTLHGWYDTDAYNVLFPLLIFLGLFLALDTKPGLKKRMSLILLPVTATFIYSLFWRGWLLFFFLCLAALVVSSLTGSLLFKNTSKKPGLFKFLLIYAVSPLGLVAILWGTDTLRETAKEGVLLAQSFIKPSISLWPDVFLSVGELHPLKFSDLMREMGGSVFYFLALAGFCVAASKYFKKKQKNRLTAALFLFIFFLETSILGTHIERFALLLVAPMALGLALCVESCLHRFNKRKNILIPMAKVVLTVTLSGIILSSAHKAVRYEHPIYNETWDKMMRELKESTPVDSIVTSWWSPGHFITAVAERRVTFDGATQNTPQAYWVARFFLEDSEKNSLGILRMLNSSGNEAVEFLLKRNASLSAAVNLVRSACSLDKQAASRLLQAAGARNEDAQPLLALTHPENKLPSSIVLVYDNMIKQMMALEYVGNWDFKKAENFVALANESPDQIDRKALKRNSPEYARLMWALSAGPWAQEDEAYALQQKDGWIQFTNGLSLKMDLSEAHIESKKFGRGNLKSLFYMENGVLEEKQLQNAGVNLSLLLIKNEALRDGKRTVALTAVPASDKLIKSLAFRLFYLKGEGLKNFRLIAAEENPKDRTKLYAYEVLWGS